MAPKLRCEDTCAILAHMKAQQIAQQRVKSAKGGTRQRTREVRIWFITQYVRCNHERLHVSITDAIWLIT
jgi:hypothetical protein